MFRQLTRDVLGRLTSERIEMTEAGTNDLVKTGFAVPVTEDGSPRRDLARSIRECHQMTGMVTVCHPAMTVNKRFFGERRPMTNGCYRREKKSAATRRDRDGF